MPEGDPSINPESDPTANPEGDPAKEPTVDLEAELAKWKADARKHEARARENAKALKELETLKQSQMSETERAISEAVSKARKDWQTEASAKLALTEFKAKASGRFAEDKLDLVMSSLNVSAFLDDDGEPNSKAIDDFLDGIAPAKGATTDFGQGARGNGMGNATPLNSDALAEAVNNLFRNRG